MRILILILFLLGCKSSQIVMKDSNSKSFVSKTYFYLGNSFEGKYESKIDTENYSWRDSFHNNQLVLREYPKYQGLYKRKESFEYYKSGEPKKTVIKTTYPNQIESKDSTVYNVINESITEVINGGGKKIHQTSNDTLYTKHVINGKYRFTSREFWETKIRKHDQIIGPTLSEILNVFVHNENGDLIEIERYENSKFVGKTMTIEYEYDLEKRITLKETYYGEGEKIALGSKGITIYE